MGWTTDDNASNDYKLRQLTRRSLLFIRLYTIGVQQQEKYAQPLVMCNHTGLSVRHGYGELREQIRTHYSPKPWQNASSDAL